METKICKNCQAEKEKDDFPKDRALCKICYSERRKQRRLANIDKERDGNKKSYQKYKLARIQSVTEYRRQNKDKVKIWSKKNKTKKQKEWSDWKSTLKCSNCPESHISCLEFHHIDPSQKEGLITKLRFSKEKLQKELEKCIVLCSNCHRKLHYQQNKQ